VASARVRFRLWRRILAPEEAPAFDCSGGLGGYSVRELVPIG